MSTKEESQVCWTFKRLIGGEGGGGEDDWTWGAADGLANCSSWCAAVLLHSCSR